LLLIVWLNSCRMTQNVCVCLVSLAHKSFKTEKCVGLLGFWVSASCSFEVMNDAMQTSSVLDGGPEGEKYHCAVVSRWYPNGAYVFIVPV
jgi:hypothetical protein